ncbi:hypothetical protein F8388_013086 [Cannabis sativa]|uniref:Reverse transcriptase zinc-binding domain-containing protein n=1 Tax=Cannabis sativa TaxID=3483 RepID=A0A7J6HGC4_CANSA|nr:hypothetical protein F8388_013086 [Cannabis sativa]KAF4393698.1 hypothetical protein G4B88_007684 [Cannabis sativa]
MLWRAVSNCLPTCSQFIQMHVKISSYCPRCNQEAETIGHCPSFCSIATACWRAARLLGGSAVFSSFGDWFQHQFQWWSKEDKQVGAILCWVIWHDQNNKVWNGKSNSVKNVVAFAKCDLEQCYSATSIPSGILDVMIQ